MAFDSKYGHISVDGIPEDEPVFVLRAHDRWALSTIRYYRSRVRNEQHRQSLLRPIDEFTGWAHTHGTKEPD